ncbi:MAG: hypothetical protein JSV25_05665 [Spirochaetota bacterium]|nr:MAG: hypothetical protein JSV25_05665 [Spirochaetota bacterium]
MPKKYVIDGDKILDNLERRLLHTISKKDYKNVLKMIIEEKLNTYKEIRDILDREIHELSTLLEILP